MADSTDWSCVPNNAKLATPLSAVTLMYPDAICCPTRSSKYCVTSFDTRRPGPDLLNLRPHQIPVPVIPIRPCHRIRLVRVQYGYHGDMDLVR